MGRLLAGVLTVVAGVALVLSGWQFAQVLEDWRNGPADLPQVHAPLAQDIASTNALQPTELRWLPIFGVSRARLPKRSGAQDATFDYGLKGVVATGNMRWAILTKAGRDLLVQEGDRLEGDAEILAIHAEGLDVQLSDRVLSLGFSENRPVAVQRIASETPKSAVPDQRFATMLPPKETTEVIFQGVSHDELVKILQKAEADRRKNGLFGVTR